jgi:putative transposase
MTVAKRNKRVKPDPELVKLADSLLANYQKPEDLIGENGLLKPSGRAGGATGHV